MLVAGALEMAVRQAQLVLVRLEVALVVPVLLPLLLELLLWPLRPVEPVIHLTLACQLVLDSLVEHFSWERLPVYGPGIA